MSVDADIQTSLLGKSASDLQSDIEIADGKITGTLKYVDDYTGFSGDASEQVGNYLALHFESDEAETITINLIGGTSGEKPLDEDGLAVFRITDKDAQSIEVKVTDTDTGHTSTYHYGLSGLTLNEE